ncbi:MAG: prepilin-type N-terminal cleavage/methylation domain-containing protein [Actinomycetales bacterium]
MVDRPPRADEGFSMMEVLVAAMIFALAATVLAGVFIKTLGLAQSNTQRTTAANLATQQMEKLRAMDATQIPDGQTTIGPVTVGGTSYTLTQYVELKTQDGTACVGTGTELTAKQITVLVTWPNQGAVKPVRSDTIRTLNSTDDVVTASKGALAVTVQAADGTGTASIPVTLTTSTGTFVQTLTSGVDGCVVFTGLAPGSYLANANTMNYVDQDGDQSTSSTALGVTANTIAKGVLPYDLLGGIAITPQTPDVNYPVPSAVGLTLTTSVWSPSQNRPYVTCVGATVSGCVSGTSLRNASSLFPAKYGAWAGTCSDAATLAGTPTLATVKSGNTTSYTVSNFGRARAVIGPLVVGGPHLYAVHAADAVCPSGEIYDLGTVTAGQTVNTALPWGTWRLQLTTTGVPTTQTVSLSSGVSSPQTVTVLL